MNEWGLQSALYLITVSFMLLLALHLVVSIVWS